MSNPDQAMDAIRAGLAAALPGMTVRRGLRYPDQLGDDVLRAGALCLVAEGMDGWQEHLQREGELGTLRFAAVFYGRLPITADDGDTEAIERLELGIQSRLLAWVQSVKPDPIDAVYPKRTRYSQGIDAPVAWLVMELEALYV